MTDELPPHPRELRITPAVRTFLNQHGATAPGRELMYEIGRALRSEGPRKRKNETLGCARFFCLRVVDAATPGGPERVIVWNGPTEGGIFYNNKVLERTELFEVSEVGIN